MAVCQYRKADAVKYLADFQMGSGLEVSVSCKVDSFACYCPICDSVGYWEAKVV